MKRRIVFTGTAIMSIVVLVVLAVPQKSPAQNHRGCSNGTLRGSYAIRVTGSLNSLPIGFVGLFSYDGQGQFTGDLTLRITDAVNGPATSSAHYLGTYSVNPDCTFQETTVNQTNGGSNSLSGTITDSRAVFFLLVTSTGPSVISGEGRKISLDGNDRD